MKTHISAVHEKNRPYVCDVCGHAFNNKGNLQDHRVLHNDEKLFNCPKCPKRFEETMIFDNKRHNNDDFVAVSKQKATFSVISIVTAGRRTNVRNARLC